MPVSALPAPGSNDHHGRPVMFLRPQRLGPWAASDSTRPAAVAVVASLRSRRWAGPVDQGTGNSRPGGRSLAHLPDPRPAHSPAETLVLAGIPRNDSGTGVALVRDHSLAR